MKSYNRICRHCQKRFGTTNYSRHYCNGACAREGEKATAMARRAAKAAERREPALISIKALNRKRMKETLARNAYSKLTAVERDVYREEFEALMFSADGIMAKAHEIIAGRTSVQDTEERGHLK